MNIFYDTECFKTFYCALFLIDDTWHTFVYNKDTNDRDKLQQFILEHKKDTFIGFNSLKYDNYTINTWLQNPRASVKFLKDSSDMIIETERTKVKRVQIYNVSDCRDVFSLLGEMGSLKKHAVAEKFTSIVECPIDFNADTLTTEEEESIMSYCKNDVLITQHLYNLPKVQDEITARLKAGELYNIPRQNALAYKTGIISDIAIGKHAVPKKTFVTRNEYDVGSLIHKDIAFEHPILKELKDKVAAWHIKVDFKKWPFERVDTLILDESHTMCGVSPATKYKNRQPVLKASQCYTRTQEFIHKYKPKKIFLLSATPVPQPFAVWGAGKLLGKTWSFNAWRQTFYVQYKHLWLPKRTAVTKKLLEEAIRELGVVGQLEDWFDVPKQTEQIVNLPVIDDYINIRNEMRLEYPNPVVYIGKLHQVEQQGLEKAKEILKLWQKHGKVAVFCKYTRQIDEIYSYLAPKLAQKGHLDILDGRTKDREKVLQTSVLAPSAVLLIQSQVSAGYELPTFDHMIFASLSYSYVDYFQAKGRILRANNLKKNWYYFLIAGEIDKAIYKCVMIKKDFSELEYEETRSTSDDPY